MCVWHRQKSCDLLELRNGNDEMEELLNRNDRRWRYPCGTVVFEEKLRKETDFEFLDRCPLSFEVPDYSFMFRNQKKTALVRLFLC